MLILFLICSPLLLLGVTLMCVTKSGKVPPWLTWWVPMAKSFYKYQVNEQCTHAERIQMDGLSFLVFGLVVIFWFELVFLLWADWKIVGDLGVSIITMFGLFLSGRVSDFLCLQLLKRSGKSEMWLS